MLVRKDEIGVLTIKHLASQLNQISTLKKVYCVTLLQIVFYFNEDHTSSPCCGRSFTQTFGNFVVNANPQWTTFSVIWLWPT